VAGNFIPLRSLTLILTLCFEAGEEVVDLTCESSEPVVVDLTHNDSVVVSSEWHSYLYLVVKLVLCCAP